jgi:hypothetical protein
MTGIFPIHLNPEQYWTAAFILFQIGMFYTMEILFLTPDEKEDETHSDY